jgi:hypothetical protein
MRASLLLFGASLVVLATGCSSTDRSDVVPADEGALRTTTSSNDLTEAQEQEVLDQIDDACGDAWCEGDLDYRFIHFKCNFADKRCTLTAKTADTTKRPKKWTAQQTCTMKQITRYEDVIETASNGFKSLKDWEKVDECVSSFE